MKVKNILITAAVLLCSAVHIAAQCRLNVMTLPISQIKDVPADIDEQISSRLMQLLNSDQIGVSTDYSQFFVTARFANVYKETLPGPPEQFVVRTQLTIWIGDLENKSIFSSCTIDLRGTGTSETRAYINALKQANANSTQLAEMIQTAYDRILNYYDTNYSKILLKATNAANQENYDEALAYIASIPECCKGWEQAQSKIVSIYRSRCNVEGQRLLTEAQGVWAANPTDEGASEAMTLINQISPSASCYKQASQFVSKMQSVVKANWDFENKTKFKSEVEIRKQAIAAARAIAVERAKNQPKTIVRNNWYWW